MTAAAVPLLFLFLIGCPQPYVPKKLEMEAIGTTKNVPTDTPDDSGDGGTVAPNSGTPGADGNGSSLCSGSEFDDLADTLKSCETPMPKAADIGPMKDKLDVKTVVPPSTTPGGHVDVQVTLHNRSSEPLALYFTGDPYPRFDVEVTNEKGKRVDLPSQRWPGYPKGFKPEAREAKASRVTLAPNGSAKIHVTWDAVKVKWAPDKARTWEGRGYPRVPSGPLAKGRYSLRVVLPILGDVDIPKVPIEVGAS